MFFNGGLSKNYEQKNTDVKPASEASVNTLSFDTIRVRERSELHDLGRVQREKMFHKIFFSAIQACRNQGERSPTKKVEKILWPIKISVSSLKKSFYRAFSEKKSFRRGKKGFFDEKMVSSQKKSRNKFSRNQSVTPPALGHSLLPTASLHYYLPHSVCILLSCPRQLGGGF